LKKTPGLGSRIDIVLTLVRIGFFFGDHELIKANLKRAEECVACYLLRPVVLLAGLTMGSQTHRRGG
jgi:hypothetical protein